MAAQAENCPTVLVAHRGDMSGNTPENSLAALRAAAVVGVKWVELDVRVSRDGHPVVIHDAGLRRTTTSRGRVRRKTLAQLRAAKLSDGSPLPSLTEALDVASRLDLGVVLDLKDVARLDMAQFARTVNGYSDLVVGLRSPDPLRQLRELSPSVKTLGFASGRSEINQFVANGISAVRLWPHRARSDPDLLKELRKNQVEVWVTTGRLAGPRMSNLLDLTVDAIITDVPAGLIENQCCC